MDLGTRLKNLRNLKGLSQRQLAQIVGSSHQSIAAYERNENMEKIKVLQRLCDFFCVSADYLINGAESETFGQITAEEILLLSKYHALSEHDKSIVDYILNIDDK